MDNTIYILFICIVIPLLVTIPLIQSSSRHVMIYLVTGIVAALFVSEINGLLLGLFHNDMLFVTTTVTPATEEIVKALPVLYYAFLFSTSRPKLLSVSFSLGIGFALFENSYILIQNVEVVSLGWAVIRGFSTALMHGVCTAAIGYGLSFVKIRRKLSVPGTFALLITAIIYHGIFNMLVQSTTYKYCGFFLPALTYIPFFIVLLTRKRSAAKTVKE